MVRSFAAVIVALTVGCGRIGFAPVDGMTTDAADPPANFLIASPKLSDEVPYSWVDLEVDWGARLAYVGSREAGECVAVVDFWDETAPLIAFRLTPPVVAGSTCLGVALSGRYLFVASLASGAVTAIDRGDDPRQHQYRTLGEASIPQVRRIIARPSTFGMVEVFAGSSDESIAITRSLFVPGPEQLTQDRMFAAPACATDYNAVGIAGDTVFTQCADEGASVLLADMTTFGSTGEVAMPGIDCAGWSAASTASGSVAISAGWCMAVLQPVAGGVIVAARLDNDGGHRGATFDDSAATPRAWLSRDDGVLELMSFADPSAPAGLARVQLEPELYDVAIKPDGTRGIAISNRGRFYVFDPALVPAATFSYPSL